MLATCTASTEDLTTVAMTKAMLGITGTSDDGLLGTLIARATTAVEGYLGYPVRLQVYSESVAGFGQRNLMLARTPIRIVLRAFDSTDTGTATAVCSSEYRIEDATAGLLSRDAGFAWTAPIATEFVDYHRPGQETRPWLFEYAAGWQISCTTSTALGVTSTGVEVPGDILMAVDETVKGWYVGRQQDPAVSSVTVGSLSMSFGGKGGAIQSGSLPASATALLTRYRRLA